MDQARLDVLRSLNQESTLLVLDWAMKFLPRKFRESQSDWFGKRGISWHLTVATRKNKDGENEMVTFVDDDSSESDDESGLFFCREEGCTRSFQRFSSLQKYLDYGSHKCALERETLYDKAMLGYAAKLEQGATAEVLEIPTADIHLEQPHESVLQKEWVLKSTKQRKRLSEKQRKYLLDVYQIGESTGHKAEPASVARSMRMSKNSDGSLLFDASEFLIGARNCKFIFPFISKEGPTHRR